MVRLNVIMLSIVMLNFIVLSVIMLNVIVLSVIILNVLMLRVIILNVFILGVIMLSGIMLSVVMLSVGMLGVVMLSVVMLIYKIDKHISLLCNLAFENRNVIYMYIYIYILIHTFIQAIYKLYTYYMLIIYMHTTNHIPMVRIAFFRDPNFLSLQVCNVL